MEEVQINEVPQHNLHFTEKMGRNKKEKWISSSYSSKWKQSNALIPRITDVRTTRNLLKGFPDGSDSKEFTYHAGDLGSIPGDLGSIPGDLGSILQIPLEKVLATHPITLS